MSSRRKIPDRHREPWTTDEDLSLEFQWGEKRLERIARNLSRTPSAVLNRARQMGLGSHRQGTKTLKGMAERSGYAVSTLKLAAERAGVILRRNVQPDPRWARPTSNSWYAISYDQEEAILAAIREVFDGDRARYHPSRKGEWGGRARGLDKPPACLECGTSERPHYSKGLCARCYDRARRARKRAITLQTESG